MKAFSSSFLYFFIAFSIFGLKCYSQQKDSTRYYYNKIQYPAKSSDIPLAIQYYTAQSEKYLAAKNHYEAIKALRMIAIGQFEIGNTYDSESAAVKAIAIIENSPQSDTLIESRVGLYNQLGKIYRANDQPEKAIEVYNRALYFTRTTPDSMTLLNNKATVYKDSRQYQKALDQLELGLQKKNRKEYPSQLARLLDNKGYIQSKLNNPNALPNLNQALEIRDSLHDLMGIFSSNKHLALYYMERNDKQLAKSFATKAYETANKLNSLTYLEDALYLFAIMENDPKLTQLNTITDSIAKQKQMAQNKYAYLKYNVEKERKNTMEERLEKEQQKNQKIIFISLASFILLISIYLIITLRQKHKKEKIIEVHKTEARISKKVHDEVANDVYQLMAKVQGTDHDKEALLDDLEIIYTKTRDISKENSTIEIGADFSEQLKDLLLTYQTDTIAISTRNLATLDWEVIPKIKKETVYRVLQELMTNMKKYSKASAVLLTFKQNGKNITIEYTDNGIGCALKNKNGLQNAENRIQAIKGTITFESEPGNGFRSKISI